MMTVFVVIIVTFLLARPLAKVVASEQWMDCDEVMHQHQTMRNDHFSSEITLSIALLHLSKYYLHQSGLN